jgi:hypothetical protein
MPICANAQHIYTGMMLCICICIHPIVVMIVDSSHGDPRGSTSSWQAKQPFGRVIDPVSAQIHIESPAHRCIDVIQNSVEY